jgi:hypothetical protein
VDGGKIPCEPFLHLTKNPTIVAGPRLLYLVQDERLVGTIVGVLTCIIIR